MIRTIKPKNARSKRALAKKEAKLVENTKSALFVPGSTGNKLLHDAMCDLMALKKPEAKKFGRKNEIRPFEDAAALEFFAEKNDASLMVFSSNNKKRPNTLIFTRFFNHKVYDMIELSIQQNYKLLQDFKKLTFSIGLKPMFVFNGPAFDSHPVFQHVKSLFLDFYRGEETDLQDVAGLQYVIALSVGEIEDLNNTNDKNLPLLHFRVYKLKSYKSGQKLPRIEIDEIGPRFDFKIGRRITPAPEVEKEANRKPKQLEAKVKKNVSTDFMGDKVAQIHVGKQDLAKLQTRKMKGLKSKYDQLSEDEEEEDYGEEEYADEIESDEEVVEDDQPQPKKQRASSKNMSLTAGSIFKARKTASDVSSPAQTRSPSAQPAQGKNKSGQELTKNQHYCVSRLPALPSVFTKSDQSESFLNAYSDYASNYSLVVNENSIFVWSYKSADSNPLSIEFPLDKNNTLPLAILTRPAAANGTSQDPGLVIIDSGSGLFKFYESVQHAPTLGLINDRSLQLTISMNKNEYITLAENVEPSGIVIATSLKRCILIQLRDYQNKPQLSSIELPCGSSNSFLSKFFGSKSENDNEVVSISSGRITNHGTTQEIIVQDSVGNFNLIYYNLLSATASPFIDSRKSFKQNLIPYIENSIDGYLPGSQLNIQFLDMWPLLSHEDDVYLALCYIDEIYQSNKSLMLMTMKINHSGGILLGCHKLTNFNSGDLITKPKLYLPQPGKTAFVIVDNSIIITDLNTSYIDSTSTFTSYYKPRWEDIIRLKSTVEIIGTGYEDQSPSSNRAVIIITKKHGVLRVERFAEEEYEVDNMDIEEVNKTDPLLIVKSHIEQGIFYSNSSEIDFDFVNIKFDNSMIISSIEVIVEEILNSKSPYILKLPSISDSTKEKVKLYQELIKYIRKNFPEISPNIVPHIVDNLEKVNVAMNLWICMDEDANSKELKEVLETIIVKETKVESHDDILREFYDHGLESINQIFVSFIEQISQKNILISILVNTLYNGVYLNEIEYITSDPEIPAYKSWIFETSLIVILEQIFTREFVENRTEVVNQQYKDNAHHLVEVLYYFVNCAIKFMEVSQDSLLKQYKSWYKARRQDWIGVLLKLGLNYQAIVITEQYHDFASLARILDTQTEDSSGDQFIKYFEMFGFEFATSLYHYYLKNDKINSLILSFPNYKHYLVEYFQNNPKQTAKVSWIRYLIDGQFDQASESLLYSAQVQSIDNLHNKSVKYSLAKLSTIAAGINNPQITGEKLIEIEDQLVMIRYQSKCLDAVMKLLGQNIEILNSSYFIKHFTNKNINTNIIEPLVDGYFSRFTANIQLSSIELINLLTSLKPNLIDKLGFAYALDVAQSGFSNESLVDYYTRIVWLRLLILGEDDKVISQFNSKKFNDVTIRQNVQDSTLYKTLTTIKLNSSMVEKLDSLLANPVISDEYEDNIVVQTFNQQLLTSLHKNLKKENFKIWIESVKGEAKLSLQSATP
ncbi:Ribosome biogenesis protein RPF2 [Spathaspora sp. JA1]|nr:Ribosome biogenesis protein RPF2 [Spathaspora sp. JA1]